MESQNQSQVSPPLWRRLLATFGGFFLGAVLLIAAWAKTLDPQAFARQVEQEGLDFLLPAMAVALIALVLEVFLGSALVLGWRPRWILWPSAALVVFFLFLTGRSYWRYTQGIVPEEGGCGCFGNLVERTPAEAFWQDLLLMVPALLLAFLVVHTTRPWPKARLAVVSLLSLATLLVAWKAPELPLDNLATKLKPGVEVGTICVGNEEEGTRECLDSARLVPELSDGQHLVVLADLDDEALIESVGDLNDYHWAGTGPRLWIVTSADEDTLFQFQFGHGAAFDVREAPAPMLHPLYRTLPRSFLVDSGKVLETWTGLPPVDRWLPEIAAEDADRLDGEITASDSIESAGTSGS